MQVALQGKNAQIHLIVELYTLINEQVVCKRGTKWKKVYFKNVCNIAMWLYWFLAVSETTSLLFKEQRQKEVEKEFPGLSYDILLEIIINCITTKYMYCSTHLIHYFLSFFKKKKRKEKLFQSLLDWELFKSSLYNKWTWYASVNYQQFKSNWILGFTERKLTDISKQAHRPIDKHVSMSKI